MTSLLHPSSILVDTNVWIAYLLGIRPNCEEATELFEACARQGIALLYAPTTIKDVFYVVPREARRIAKGQGEDVSHVSFSPLAWASVRKITEVAAAATLSLPECELAYMLRGKHDDFEDNLIIAAAETCNADYVATYDKDLVSHFAPACATPKQLLSIMS